MSDMTSQYGKIPYFKPVRRLTLWGASGVRMPVAMILLVLIYVFLWQTFTGPDAAFATEQVGADVANVYAINQCEIVYQVDCSENYFEFDPGKGVDGRIIARVFSSTVCNIERLFGEVFGQMWCAISDRMQEPLAALLTLYMAILGLAFMLGVIPMTLKEVSMRIFKLLLVYAFVTQADFALGILFQFYMLVLKEGLIYVLTNPVDGSAPTSVAEVMQNLDATAESIFGGPEDELMTFVSGAIALFTTVPGGGVLGSALMAEGMFSFFVFAKTVLVYLVSIAGMIFLMTLGPIFICFALFKPTQEIFEKWIKHITSYALQPIIVFAYVILMERYLVSVKELIFDPAVFNSDMLVYDPDTIDQNVGPMSMLMGLPRICDGPVQGGECGITIPPDFNYAGTANITPGLQPTAIGVAALLILDFVTLAFLDIVPEIARQITNAPRVLKLGGGEEHWTGSTLRLPGSSLFKDVTEGIKNGGAQGGVQGARDWFTRPGLNWTGGKGTNQG